MVEAHDEAHYAALVQLNEIEERVLKALRPSAQIVTHSLRSAP
jgi:hypothetical protein